MIYEVDVDTQKILLRLDKGYKRMLFTTVQAINQTALSVQAQVRAHVRENFTIRKGDFIPRQVKYFGASFSTTGTSKWEARVGIGIGKELQGSPLLLPGYETGFTRRPVVGKESVAVPVGARETKASVIPTSLYVSRLKLKRTSVRRSMGGAQIVRRGLARTYQIPEVGIFQRVSNLLTRILYVFARPFRIEPRLEFFATARRVIKAEYARNVQRSVNEAFARHG